MTKAISIIFFLILSATLQISAQSKCADTTSLDDHFKRANNQLVPGKLGNTYIFGTNGIYSKIAQQFSNIYEQDANPDNKLMVAGVKIYFDVPVIKGQPDVTRKIEVYKMGQDGFPEAIPVHQQVFSSSDIQPPQGGFPKVTFVKFDFGIGVGKSKFFVSVDVGDNFGDDTIRILSNKEPQGLSQMRTKALKKSNSTWVSVMDDMNYNADAMIIALVANDCTGIEEIGSLENLIDVFPTIASNNININLNSFLESSLNLAEISIFNLEGKIVNSPFHPYELENKIPVYGLKNGMYILQVKVNNQSAHYKILIFNN